MPLSPPCTMTKPGPWRRSSRLRMPSANSGQHQSRSPVTMIRMPGFYPGSGRLNRVSAASSRRLPAAPAHTASTAFGRRLAHLDDLGQVAACRPDLLGNFQHPRPELVGVLDPVPPALL